MFWQLKLNKPINLQVKVNTLNLYLFLKENPEFHLHFDKTYKWVASSVQDKNNFITALIKVLVDSLFTP